jgi:hypothetical protein
VQQPTSPSGLAKNGPAVRQIISQEKRRQIIAVLKDNSNATQVAQEVGGANYRTVVRLAEEAGIELTAGKAARGCRGISPEMSAQIIGELENNPNATQVARKISCVSNTTVGKIAKAAGITLAGAEHGKRLSAEERAQIIAALKANPNAAERRSPNGRAVTIAQGGSAFEQVGNDDPRCYTVAKDPRRNPARMSGF